MSTSTTPTARPLRPFHTPVRGHVFSRRPPSGAALERARLTLRLEPDNPADPYAVAVWADGGGVPWRVGYLERAVAARLTPRLDGQVQVRFAGWWDAPVGQRQRPVVWIGPADAQRPEHPGTLRALPPARIVHAA